MDIRRSKKADTFQQVCEVDFTIRGNRESLGYKRDINKEKMIESEITRTLRKSFFFRFIIIDTWTRRMGSRGLESSPNCVNLLIYWLGKYSSK